MDSFSEKSSEINWFENEYRWKCIFVHLQTIRNLVFDFRIICRLIFLHKIQITQKYLSFILTIHSMPKRLSTSQTSKIHSSYLKRMQCEDI